MNGLEIPLTGLGMTVTFRAIDTGYDAVRLFFKYENATEDFVHMARVHLRTMEDCLEREIGKELGLNFTNLTQIDEFVQTHLENATSTNPDSSVAMNAFLLRQIITTVRYAHGLQQHSDNKGQRTGIKRPLWVAGKIIKSCRVRKRERLLYSSGQCITHFDRLTSKAKKELIEHFAPEEQPEPSEPIPPRLEPDSAGNNS